MNCEKLKEKLDAVTRHAEQAFRSTRDGPDDIEKCAKDADSWHKCERELRAIYSQECVHENIVARLIARPEIMNNTRLGALSRWVLGK